MIEKTVFSNVLALCGCPCVLYRWIVPKKLLRVLTQGNKGYQLLNLRKVMYLMSPLEDLRSILYMKFCKQCKYCKC